MRTLYEKYLEVSSRIHDLFDTISCWWVQYDPSNCSAWIKFAELESTLGDLARARAIFELAASQPALDMPELLWKSYIDLEVEEGERERVRALYERLLERSGHVKVWISYALFESATIGINDDDSDAAPDIPPENQGNPQRTREVFERGYKDLRGKEWTDVSPIPNLWAVLLIIILIAACGIARSLESLRVGARH